MERLPSNSSSRGAMRTHRVSGDDLVLFVEAPFEAASHRIRTTSEETKETQDAPPRERHALGVEPQHVVLG